MIHRLRDAGFRWWNPGHLFLILVLILPTEACRWVACKAAGRCYPYCKMDDTERVSGSLNSARWEMKMRCRKCGHEFVI